MRTEWLAKWNGTEKEEPEFEYYEFENWLMRNYYVSMTIWSQGESTHFLNSCEGALLL